MAEIELDGAREIVFAQRPLTNLIKRDYTGQKVFQTYDNSVLQSRIAGAEKAAGRLSQLHHFVLKQNEHTWHHDMRGPGSAHDGGNPEREFFDEDLRIVTANFVLDYSPSSPDTASSLIHHAKVLEQHQHRHQFLQVWALRLRLCAAGYTQVQAAEYLSVSLHRIRQLDELLKMPTPPRHYWQVPLKRKRAPKAGWAEEILARSIRSNVTDEESLRMLLKPLDSETSLQKP